MFKTALSLLGMNAAQVAQQLAQYGDPAEIQTALENGDVKSLSFIEKAAQRIQQTNPQLYSMVQSMYANRR